MKVKQISSHIWEKTSMIERLFFNNLDKQPTWESTARDNQCLYALTTEIRRVSLNYGHSYAQFSHRMATATHLLKKKDDMPLN